MKEKKTKKLEDTTRSPKIVSGNLCITLNMNMWRGWNLNWKHSLTILRLCCYPPRRSARYCTHNKAILLRHHYFLYTKAEGSDVRYYPYAYVNGCSVPAGQPATKGPHLLSKGYYSCCARLVKKKKKRCRGIMCIKGRGGPLHSILLSQQHISI